MKYKVRSIRWTCLLIAALFACLALYGLLYRKELILAAGLAVAFLSILLMEPVVQQTRSRVRLIERTGTLAEWEYTQEETAEIAAVYKRKAAKRGRGVALLFFLCLTVILWPFASMMISSDAFTVAYVLFSMGWIPLVPWITAALYPAVYVRHVTRLPCITRIGMDYVLLANMCPRVNDYLELKAYKAALLPEHLGEMAILRIEYHSMYWSKTGKHKRTTDVDIPVPMGREESAEQLALQLNRLKKG